MWVATAVEVQAVVALAAGRPTLMRAPPIKSLQVAAEAALVVAVSAGMETADVGVTRAMATTQRVGLAVATELAAHGVRLALAPGSQVVTATVGRVVRDREALLVLAPVPVRVLLGLGAPDAGVVPAAAAMAAAARAVRAVLTMLVVEAVAAQALRARRTRWRLTRAAAVPTVAMVRLPSPTPLRRPQFRR
jgi:hypothetical protein